MNHTPGTYPNSDPQTRSRLQRLTEKMAAAMLSDGELAAAASRDGLTSDYQPLYVDMRRNGFSHNQAIDAIDTALDPT